MPSATKLFSQINPSTGNYSQMCESNYSLKSKKLFILFFVFQLRNQNLTFFFCFQISKIIIFRQHKLTNTYFLSELPTYVYEQQQLTTEDFNVNFVLSKNSYLHLYMSASINFAHSLINAFFCYNFAFINNILH